MRMRFRALARRTRPGSSSQPRPSVDGLWLASLFGPLALLVVTSRLMEMSNVGTIGLDGFLGRIWMYAPLPTLGLGIGVAVMLVARRWHPAVAVALGMGACVLTWQAVKALPVWWLQGWLSTLPLAYMQWDLVWLGLLLLAATAWLAAPQRAGAFWLRRTVIQLVAVGVAAFYAVEAVLCLTLGMPGIYFPALDFLANARALLPVLLDSVTPTKVALLALPASVLLGPTLVSLGRRLQAPATEPEPSGAAAFLVWGTTLLLAALLMLPAPETDEVVESAVARLIATAYYDAQQPALGGVGDAVAFDARNLRLVARADRPATMSSGTAEGSVDANRAARIDTASGDTTAASLRRNVVVILLESVRATATTPHDSTLATMPFLDRLAEHGTLYERTYASTSYTNKSIVTALGGVPPSPDPRVERAEAVPGGLPTPGLPGLLREHGYRTAFVTPAMFEFERKDLVLGNLGFEDLLGHDDHDRDGFTPKAYFGYEDRVTLATLERWLDAPDPRPFFLSILTLTAHHPYDTPPDFPLRSFVRDAELNAYYNAIRYTDVYLREVVALFRDRGLLDETLFVVTGDHGQAFGEHGVRTHGDIIWDEVLHVPMLLVGPGIEAGQRDRADRHHADLMPTVADWLGYDLVGGTIPGHSLLAPPPPGRRLYHAMKNGRNALALRVDGTKYIYWGRRRPMQVFDTINDPLELHDLAAERPEGELRAVEAELIQWRRSVELAYEEARARSAAARQSVTSSS
ncbi:MAG: LTA synthase family protein [Bacteroidota bacterium]